MTRWSRRPVSPRRWGQTNNDLVGCQAQCASRERGRDRGRSLRRLPVVVPACALAVGGVLGLGATGWVSAAAPPPLDLVRVTWRELHLEAHKLGVAGRIVIRLIAPPVAAAGLAGARQSPADQRPGSGTGDLWLESTTHLPGRLFVARERLDPRRPAAFEIVDTETGVKRHRKAYALSDQGFTLELLEPASLAELTLGTEGWTRHVSSAFSYPASLGTAPPVTGPAGLLYALSAGNVRGPGDSMTVYVLVQTQVERVTITAEGRETIQADYQQIEGGQATTIDADVNALRLVARSAPVDPATPSAFRIFGLEGIVEILWDAERRLPLEMSGQVRLLGHVEVHLTSVELR